LYILLGSPKFLSRESSNPNVPNLFSKRVALFSRPGVFFNDINTVLPVFGKKRLRMFILTLWDSNRTHWKIDQIPKKKSFPTYQPTEEIGVPTPGGQ
jgi:hypothetical protein